ncbi:MAG: NYN domain-containing protein, partial [Acidimicrobiales bacterium]
MATRHVVVDGSNLATEGRSMPSLAQLDTAVREFLQENPDDMVTVVVDASFGHRIDPSEFKVFEEAEAAGELVSPPAGAIGRGDAFLLRIADKTGATVLSNDSFQEFHGDYEWLFERGRLIGGKPVPGVGWIFTPRTPVRGPRSREAVKEAKRKSKTEAESAVPGLDLAASRTRGKGKKTVERAIAVATEEAVTPKEKSRRRRKGGDPPADPVNDPLTFITFIAAHPLGAEVIATVESFASHGAFVECAGARCYVPLSAMGEPPPKSAREIFGKGQDVRLIVQALDPHRRGVELALPGYAKIAGAPTDETVEAEIGSGETDGGAPAEGAGARAGAPAEGAAPARRARKRAPSAARASLEPSPAGGEGAGGEAAGPPATPLAAPARRRRGAPAVAVPEPAASEVVGAPAAGSTPARRRKAKAPSAVVPEESEATGPVPSGPAEAAGPAARGRRQKAAPRSALEASPTWPLATGPETATQRPAGAQKALLGRRSGGGP